MFDQIMTTALGKYGVLSAVALYIFKTLFDLFSGNLLRYIKAIDQNTEALKKVSHDLQIAFVNIKEIRDKNQMGPISKPGELEQ
jgi:hypothetical protein